MKNLGILLFFATVLSFPYFICPVSAENVYLNDGSAYTINDDTYQSDDIYLDRWTLNKPGTHLNITNGKLGNILAWNNSSVAVTDGAIRGVSIWDYGHMTMVGGELNNLYAYDDSTAIISGGMIDSLGTNGRSSLNISGGKVTGSFIAWNHSNIAVSGGELFNGIEVFDSSKISVTGGTIGGSLYTKDEAEVVMTGGSVQYFYARGNSTVTMTGGSTNWKTYARNDSVITFSGGKIGSSLLVYNNGMIYLDGSNFSITTGGVTTVLKYGDSLMSYCSLIENDDRDYYTGTISGILADGSLMSNDFSIFNNDYYEGIGDIVVIPEPVTLFLLGLGGLMLRKKSA